MKKNLHAVLLAGGKSRRMGRDKCLVTWGGSPLWSHQLATLAALSPTTLAVAAPTRPAWLPEGVQWLGDTLTNAGPFAGLLAAFYAYPEDSFIVVLAIDLPQMTSSYLEKVWHSCSDSKGQVPVSAQGYEPLAAIYSTQAKQSALQWVAQGRYDLQGWVAELHRLHSIDTPLISALEQALFKNINTPLDLFSSQE